MSGSGAISAASNSLLQVRDGCCRTLVFAGFLIVRLSHRSIVGWPHSSSRPAVRYPDGWSIHAWKGARVPAWVINAPQDITLDGIDTQIDPLVRNAGCYGSSLGRKWSYRGAVIDSWAVVEFPACGEVRSFRCILPHLRTLAER